METFLFYSFAIISQPTATIMFGVWLFIVLLLVCFFVRRCREFYRTRWYDKTALRPDEDMSLEEIVRCLDEFSGVVFNSTKETEVSKCRMLVKLKKIRWRQLICELPLFIALAIVALGTLCQILLQASIGSYPLADTANSVAFNSVAGIVSGTLALIGVVVTVFYQIRLTARTKNRNDWIEAVRGEVSYLISNFPECLSNHGNKSPEVSLSEVRKHLTKLELLLNPKKRVHSILIGMVYYKYGFEKIGRGSEETLKLIRDMNCLKRQTNDTCIKTTKIATGLANILLKREWEMVKHVR